MRRFWQGEDLNLKSIVLIVMCLVSAKSTIGSERFPVAAGLSIGTGFPWVLHLKPELIVRPLKDYPSISVFIELNSVILAAEVSYGLSLNRESKSGYMNSVYVGSGDDIISKFGEEGEDEWRKQFMIGWEFKKEYGYNFGYFLNAGLNLILDPDKVFPKLNIGFFFLPGF